MIVKKEVVCCCSGILVTDVFFVVISRFLFASGTKSMVLDITEASERKVQLQTYSEVLF